MYKRRQMDNAQTDGWKFVATLSTHERTESINLGSHPKWDWYEMALSSICALYLSHANTTLTGG